MSPLLTAALALSTHAPTRWPAGESLLHGVRGLTADEATLWFCRRMAGSHVETWRHSRRVRYFVRLIVDALGFRPELVRLAERSAILHDLGKILLRDVDLDKRGAFTDAEFRLVKEHPTLGAELLAPVPILRDVLPAVLHHHERWDGRGYPDGLAGEEIPLMARIVAVADTYDAMTSNRPYRVAVSHQKSMAEVMFQSGTQFDPDLVAVFVSAMGDGRRHAAA